MLLRKSLRSVVPADSGDHDTERTSLDIDKPRSLGIGALASRGINVGPGIRSASSGTRSSIPSFSCRCYQRKASSKSLQRKARDGQVGYVGNRHVLGMASCEMVVLSNLRFAKSSDQNLAVSPRVHQVSHVASLHESPTNLQDSSVSGWSLALRWRLVLLALRW